MLPVVDYLELARLEATGAPPIQQRGRVPTPSSVQSRQPCLWIVPSVGTEQALLQFHAHGLPVGSMRLILEDDDSAAQQSSPPRLCRLQGQR